MECSAELTRQVVDSEPTGPVLSEEQPGEPFRHHQISNSAYLSWDTAVELVELYLDKVHDRPHSIFHPATLRDQLRNGTVGRALLCAICAIGSKFSPYPDRRALEGRLNMEAKRLLQADIDNVCLENIQTCILIAIMSAGDCETSSEALFVRTSPLILWIGPGEVSDSADRA